MSKRWLRKVTKSVVVIIAICIASVAGSGIANAESSDYQKALGSSLLSCYSDGKFKTPLSATDFNNISSVTSFMKTGGKVPIPNGFDGDKTTMSCSDLVSKLLSNKGVAVPNGRTSSTSEITDFLKNIGYVTSSGSSTGQCISFAYHITSNSTAPGVVSSGYSATTQKICASVINADGTIGVDNVELLSGDKSAVEFQDAKNSSVTLDCSAIWGSAGGCLKHKFTKGETKWDDFVKDIMNDLLEHNSSGVRTYYSYSLENISDPVIFDNYGDTVAEYVINDSSAGQGTSFLLGSRYTTEPTFTDGEQFVLYQNYLADYYDADIHCGWTENEITVGRGQGYKEVRLYSNGEFKTCYAKATKNTSKKVNGVDDSRHLASQNCNFDCVTSWLAASTVTSLPTNAEIVAPNESGVTPQSGNDTTGGTSGGTTTSGDSNKCGKGGGGAGALGWIVCPILSWIGNATEEIYNNYLKPSLQLEPKLFVGDSDSGTRTGWSIFQGIANGLFIILLLVVIFSQITGVGIDNYGIKRILPKMIVTAVLVNLSFLLCQICVDLSNILGNGLQTLFDNLPVGSAPSWLDGDAAGSTIVSVAILGALMGGAGLVVWANPAILLSLLVSLLGMIVSIFFLFILLAAREAAVVVLVVISPLAFVCYMLPNTKRLFDRWVKMSEALLMVYPICGALIGGGNYVSRLLMSVGVGDSFATALTAMLVGIIPIFFIPTILKSSLSAMGNIGAKISGVGQRLGRGATGAMRNSEAFKLQQERGKGRAAAMRAGLKFDRKSGQYKESGRPTARLRRSLAGTAFGRATGMDRSMGRASEAAERARSQAEAERAGMDIDALNVQAAKSNEALDRTLVQAQEGYVAVSRDAIQREIQAENNKREGRNNVLAEVPELAVIEQELRNMNAQQNAKNVAGVEVMTDAEAIMRQNAKVRKQDAINNSPLENLQAQLDNEVIEAETKMSVKPTIINADNLRQRLVNQQTEILADNQVPVLELDESTAVQRKQAARDSQEYKAVSEQFAIQDRGETRDWFGRALRGVDASGNRIGTASAGIQASAALNSLLSRGGTTEVLETLEGLSNDDWANMDGEIYSRLTAAMSSSNVDSLKAFAKYRQTHDNKLGAFDQSGRRTGASFTDWSSGAYFSQADPNTGQTYAQAEQAAGVKELGLASHLQDIGVGSMHGYDKDQMQYIQRHATDLAGQMGAQNFGAMLGSAAVNSKDAKAQNISDEVLTSSLANGTLQLGQLGLTSEMIGSMRDKTASAILDGVRRNIATQNVAQYETQIRQANPTLSNEEVRTQAYNQAYAQTEAVAKQQIRTAFSNQLAGLEGDKRIYNRTREGVMDVFSVKRSGRP